MLIFAALLAVHTGLAGPIPAAPENITVTFLNPNSVRVSWQISVDIHKNPVEKYDVTYKPTDARVVAVVAGNSEAVTLHGLSPNTQYQLTVTAVWGGKKYRSRPIVFRTLDHPRSSPQHDTASTIIGSGPPMTPHAESGHGFGIFADDIVTLTSSNATNSTTRELPVVFNSYVQETEYSVNEASRHIEALMSEIRGVEVGIVVLVLIVWAGAIALFFNRWGKIRMLLPYQPDYKQDQLKVQPGAGSSCAGQHSHQLESSDPDTSNLSEPKHFHYTADEPSTTISERCTRSRINSAIFVSSEGRGFDSIEFLRRHGSQSVLCRKAKSADNISDDERKQRRFSENPQSQWGTLDSSNPSETIELAECHAPPTTTAAETLPQPQPTQVEPANTVVTTTANATSSISTTVSPERPHHYLQRQRRASTHSQTSNASSTSPILANSSQNPRPKLTHLPTLSISGPSPPHGEEFL